MKYAILLLAVATALPAFSPGSFRLQSTSGIWEDDYDLIFDPGRLPLIEGVRVYTGLSNYVTSNEALFGLNSSNFLVLGASGHLRDKYAPAALVDGHSYRRAQFTGLYGAGTGESLFGSGRAVDLVWGDQDSNGVYDYKQVRAAERNAWTAGTGNDVYVAAGYQSGKNRLGLGLSWEDSALRRTLPGLDFVFNDYDSSLVAGGLTYRRDDTSRYQDLFRQSAAALLLSGWFELKNGAQLGIGLGPQFLMENTGFDYTLAGRTDRSPNNPEVADFARETDAQSQKLSYQGLQIPLNITLTSTGEKTENWFYLRGFFRTETPASDAGTTGYSSFEQTLNPGDSSGRDSTVSAYRGNRTSFGGSVRFKELYNIGERLNLGWSLQLGADCLADSLLEDMSEQGSARYDDGDSVSTHADYTQTITGAERWLSREARRQAWLALPVGLEFKVVPGVALRLGAQHYIAWSDRIRTGQLISWSPRKTRTVFGDGSFVETIDTLSRRTASSEQRTGFDQQTQFSYGAGFRPLDNLQIDLMGFANLVNLTGWRLSATLRF